MARYSFPERMKRSIAKRLVRFLNKYANRSINGEVLTVEEAGALFMEFDKRLAAIEAKNLPKN